MSYDYNIQIAGTPLNTIAAGLTGRFTRFTSGQRRQADVVIPYRHGNLFVPDKYFTDSDVLLELFLPGGSNAAAAEALSEVALLFASQSEVAVQQDDPHRGTIEALVQMITDPIATQDRFTYLFGLNLPSGFWRTVAQSTATGNPPAVTTGGDRPVDDMVLTFAGVGFIEHTDPLGQVARVEIESGAGGTPPYVVDVGAGTVVDSGAGTPNKKDEFLVVTQEYWMKFQPGAAQSFTSNVSVTVDWHDKWA